MIIITTIMIVIIIIIIIGSIHYVTGPVICIYAP